MNDLDSQNNSSFNCGDGDFFYPEAPSTHYRHESLHYGVVRYARFSNRLLSIGKLVQHHTIILGPALLLLALVLAANWKLFVTPMIPWGDTAVNMLQVESAKHLHELLGNYSRWHFHHPGPFLFYLFAAGETLFYDWLHIVPAPLNGQCIAEILFSTACLFGAIQIFYSNIKASLFQPLAIISSILFLYAIDTAIPGSAMISTWIPYAPLFCFLLLASSCASVAAGNWRHTPILALSGMIMLHAHVVQIMFASVLIITPLSISVLRELKLRRLLPTISQYRYYLLGALGIIMLFLLPIAVDCVINQPNNIHQILLHLQKHHGEHNSIRSAALYLLSFFTYDTRPDIPLSKPIPTIVDLLNPQLFVKIYWVCFISILTAAVVLFISNGATRISTFVKSAIAEIALISILFLYWGWRMAGPMDTYNGYFFFSVQLFALFIICAILSRSITRPISRRICLVVSCACVAPVLLIAGIKSTYWSDPAVADVLFALKATHQTSFILRIQSSQNDWPTAAGIVEAFARSKTTFCVEPGWAFMFGRRRTCKDDAYAYRVSFSARPFACRRPCVVLYSRPDLYVTGSRTSAPLSLPLLIAPFDSTHWASGFDVIENTGMWSGKNGVLRFHLAPGPIVSGNCTVKLKGTALAHRPVFVDLNGEQIGVITEAEPTAMTFEIDSHWMVFGGTNVVTLKVPNAGPIGTVPRELGYWFEGLSIQCSGQPLQITAHVGVLPTH